MEKGFLRGRQLLFALCLLLTAVIILPQQRVSAANGNVTVNTVVYSEESIRINNNGNSKIYFATENEAAKNKWDVIEADTDTSYTEIDLSWLSPTVENILMFKGDKYETPTRVIIKERPQKLDVTFNYTNIEYLTSTNDLSSLINIMTSEGTSDNPIGYDDLQWKKGSGGTWKETEDLTYNLLQKYLVKGTYIYFRIGAKDDITDSTGNPDGTGGRRYSNEVKVKIAKSATAMVVGVDGEDFTVDIKYGKQYRVTTYSSSGETVIPWRKVTDRSTKFIGLETIINDKDRDGSTADKYFPAMKIEIRDYATTKAAASKITEINLNQQRVLGGSIVEGKVPSNPTAAEKNNIYVYYNGTKNIAIEIPKASDDLPYEYCIRKPTDINFDLRKATWNSITKSSAVKVLSTKAVDGSTLIIRQKEIKYKAETTTSNAVAYQLASTYLSKSLVYPSMPEVTKTNLVYTKKYATDQIITVKLNIEGKKPFENEIKSVKLGTKAINTTVTVEKEDPSSTASNPVYLMKIKLTNEDLEVMTNCSARALTINFANGTVDKTSVKLTIQNAVPAASLTVSPSQGSATGTMALTITPATAATGNQYIYIITDSPVEGVTTQDIRTGTQYTSGANITIATDQVSKWITVYEVNSTTNKVVKFKCIQISTSMIK